MCLKIEYVVNDKRAARVMPAWKVLVHARPFNSIVVNGELVLAHWRTPYRETRIPSNGLLTYRGKPSRVSLWLDNEINGGAIHSYWCVEKPPTGNGSKAFAAFAIGVFAWGSSYRADQVSRALYIPELDTFEGREDRLSLLQGPTPTVRQLVKAFPNLKRVAHLL